MFMFVRFKLASCMNEEIKVMEKLRLLISWNVKFRKFMEIQFQGILHIFLFVFYSSRKWINGVSFAKLRHV
jgi:hypothetical protein